MFTFLRSIGLNPIEWSQAIRATGSPAPFIGEVLEAAFAEAQAAVVLLSGDDMAYLHDAFRKKGDPDYEGKATPQPRPNVLFEAGMAFGRHPSETILVQVGTIRPFSDIAGRHIVRLSNAAEQRHELANRLEIAGCAVDRSGQDWYQAGNFDVEETESAQNPTLRQVQPATIKKGENALDPGSIQVLTVIGEKHYPHNTDIAEITTLNSIKVDYFLDRLRQDALVEFSARAAGWYLTAKGRAFLVENGYV